MTAELTANEMLESLTGYDEIAISRAFGRDPLELAESKPTMLARSLAFVHMTREGQSADVAKKAAMELSIRQANDYFQDSEEELLPGVTVNAEGEGDAAE